MGTYIEDIPFLLGEEEAKNRIEIWRLAEGNDFKLKDKGPDWLLIKHKTMHFVITVHHDRIRIEAVVGEWPTYSISPSAFVGAIARREGWKVYTTLKNAILKGIEPDAII
jgi:hypothetical protein